MDNNTHIYWFNFKVYVKESPVPLVYTKLVKAESEDEAYWMCIDDIESSVEASGFSIIDSDAISDDERCGIVVDHFKEEMDVLGLQTLSKTFLPYSVV